MLPALQFSVYAVGILFSDRPLFGRPSVRPLVTPSFGRSTSSFALGISIKYFCGLMKLSYTVYVILYSVECGVENMLFAGDYRKATIQDGRS